MKPNTEKRKFSALSEGWCGPTTFAVAVRLAFWIIVAFLPIANEQGQPISPLLGSSGIDLEFYVESRAAYTHMFYAIIAFDWASVIPVWRDDRDFFYFSGPGVPFLLYLFDYRPGNALPLSMVYLLFACLWAAVWVRWMAANRLPKAWLYLFGLLPIPYWLMINVSSDLPFALCVGGFYLLFFSPGPLDRRRILLLVLLAFLALAVRPNGLSLFLFAGLVLLMRNDLLTARVRISLIVVAAVAFVLLANLYEPYLLAFLRKSMVIEFFGVSQGQYISGIYGALPHWLDLTLSWLALVGAKLLYLTGLRPSYSPEALLLPMLIRASAGVILLPGLIRWCTVGSWTERIFLFCFLLPIAIGSTQERYIFAITPILFYHGVLVYQWLAETLWLGRQRRES